MSVDKFKNFIKNNNVMKKFFIFLILFFSMPCQAETDFNKIYEELQPADFKYIFGIDPYQAEDYKKYMFSPYPLLRIGVTLIFKETKIPPGYYLLTPRKYNNRTYVLFKEQGRVKYMVPAYNVDIVAESVYDRYIPKPKLTKWQKFKESVSGKVGTMFPEKTKRKPAPKAYMEINDIDGEFFQLILYYGNHKYYLIFKQEE